MIEKASCKYTLSFVTGGLIREEAKITLEAAMKSMVLHTADYFSESLLIDVMKELGIKNKFMERAIATTIQTAIF
eukprot:CAMPEP_0116883124 /NCGR_PEP_ID=MMETSP0463-20121206/15577_1 /TAXON_ID=181622 /ORGANISM="Strombidinopsis sp, Strain SopsisLIS2011" /LENGTH=74 /DNA_ID=CAMNT_0004537437 /DNA_START=536 /DNA_END=760 /DNA_ORIENTATION=-